MIYDSYAAVYDSSGQVRFALLFGQYLKQLLHRHSIEGDRMLDLACGTGTLALVMAGSGWNVVGLDLSPAMLAQARARIAGADVTGSVTFVQGDMRAVASAIVPHSYDLVTCTFDSLNYMLTEADLAACFRSVACALVPGGLFVGDMNTPHFLEHGWGTCEVSEQEGYVQVSRSHFDPATTTATMLLTGFVGDDEHGYERFDEVHAERGYPPETIAALIEDAGLQIEAAYACFTCDTPVDTTQRIAWVARRVLPQGF